MQLSKTEINILEQIAKGNKAIKAIAKALKKSDKQIYVTAKNLTEKNVLERINGTLKVKEALHITLLLQLLADIPNLAPVLSDSGIPILTAILKPLTIEEISKETGFKKTMIYSKIQEAGKRSMIRKTKFAFMINEKMWFKLMDFLKELKKYEKRIGVRIPASSTIYYKKNKEIVFSCKEEVDEIKTAFSAYEKYGIKLLLVKNYYYLPKKELTKEDILKHSLYVVEKDSDIRNLVFVALFYAKYKKEFKIKHEILTNLTAVLAGKKIDGYPTYEEIKDRAEVYGIKV